MNSATSLGNAVKISAPTNSWEQIGAKVNEGPGEIQILIIFINWICSLGQLIAALYHGGRTWIVCESWGLN